MKDKTNDKTSGAFSVSKQKKEFMQSTGIFRDEQILTFVWNTKDIDIEQRTYLMLPIATFLYCRQMQYNKMIIRKLYIENK